MTIGRSRSDLSGFRRRWKAGFLRSGALSCPLGGDFARLLFEGNRKIGGAMVAEPEQVSQVTLLGTRIWAVLPEKASVSVISML